MRSVTIFALTVFNINSFFVLLSYLFVLLRRWQFPGYALISLSVNHFNISFIKPSDDFNIELGCHQRYGWLVLQYWHQLPRGTKKHLAHEKWKSVFLKLIRAASITKLLPISWSNYHGVLPFWEEGETNFGVIVGIVKLGFWMGASSNVRLTEMQLSGGTPSSLLI